MRKPIAISESVYQWTIVCDDGSIWSKPSEKDWVRLKPIPQDQNAHEKDIQGYKDKISELKNNRETLLKEQLEENEELKTKLSNLEKILKLRGGEAERHSLEMDHIKNVELPNLQMKNETLRQAIDQNKMPGEIIANNDSRIVDLKKKFSGFVEDYERVKRVALGETRISMGIIRRAFSDLDSCIEVLK